MHPTNFLCLVPMIIPVASYMLWHRLKHLKIIVDSVDFPNERLVILVGKIVIGIPNNYPVNVLTMFEYFLAVLIPLIYRQ